MGVDMKIGNEIHGNLVIDEDNRITTGLKKTANY